MARFLFLILCMEEIHCQFAVIGTGPAGQKAAFQAAKLGKTVLLIEADKPGGNCLNSGTIPSKSLREAIIDLTRYNERGFYGSSCIHEVTINDLNYRLHAVIEGEREVLLRQLKKNRIRLLTGFAQFVSPVELEVKGEDTIYRVLAEKILISTGSTPRNPLDIPFDDEVIFDSTRLLRMPQLPKEILVLGAGVIGAEYASFFAALGCQVKVLDRKDRLLPQLDAEIGTHLQVGLKEIGLEFLPRSVPAKIWRDKNRGFVMTEGGQTFEADAVLYCLGREASVQGLGLEKINLTLSKKGYIEVSPYFQTKVPSVYAAGDVVGYPALASTSMEQGRCAARHAFSVHTKPFPNLYPLGIYTIPEISVCGQTEEELVEKGVSFEVGRAYYYEIAKSHITGSSNLGLFKILFDKRNLKILGVHIVGRNATEVIHIGLLAMQFGATVDFFTQQVFNYPTFAEGYRIAAFNGLNKL